jgi:nitrite reductase/ring-hydroxylating ferredoxin subunit
MATWHRIANRNDVPNGGGGEFVAGGRVVALYHVGGEFFALDGVCPHAGGPLGEGTLNGAVVTCPWHGWQFDVTTGQHCLNANLRHTAFAVKIDGDDVLVEIPD